MLLTVERTWLQVKSMGILFFVPLIVYYILLPVCVQCYLQNPIGQVDVFTVFADLVYSYVPVVCTWWLFLYLREFSEGEGREILILGEGVTGVIGSFYGLHCICMLPIFFVFEDKDGSVMSLYLQMLVITFFMYGLVFLLCILMKNIAISLLLTLIYCIFSTSANEFLDVLKYNSLNHIDWMQSVGLFLVLGILFWWIAHKKSKQY